MTLALSIPPGYRVEETDERVKVMGRRYFKSRAKAYARKYPPLIHSYHLKVEKVGLFLYEIVAYQNKLVKIDA